MTHISELPTPALLIDRRKLLANIARMARRATDLGVSLRPHIKTHKSPSIARLQLEEGACGITVSTPYGLSPMCSSIQRHSVSSCSGENPTAPSTPIPPALLTATTTSRQDAEADTTHV